METRYGGFEDYGTPIRTPLVLIVLPIVLIDVLRVARETRSYRESPTYFSSAGVKTVRTALHNGAANPNRMD
jgi:hypothetical protein